jgi:hypothetical protein
VTLNFLIFFGTRVRNMNKMMLAAAAAIAVWVAPAQATPLAPGGSTNNIPTVTEMGTIEGTVTTQFQYGSGANLVSGVLREVVVQPTGSNTLDFLFQVSIRPAGSGSGANAMMNMFTVSGFGVPVTTDVAQATSASNLDTQNGFFTNPLTTGTQPVMAASRSPGTGDGVTFFAPTAAGQTSDIGIIRTNANAIANGTGTVTFDGHTLVFNTLIPDVTSVPEPVTMVLWGGSFAGLAFLGAFRRRKAVTV